MRATIQILLLSTVAICGLHAQTAIDLTTPGDEFGGGEFTLGFEFSPDNNIFVTSLGVFNADGTTLPNDATIGLWDTNGDLLTSATISAGTTGNLSGYFSFTTITPYALTAGADYVVGAYLNGTASSLDTGQGGVGTFDPGINVIEDQYNDAFGFAFPNISQADTGAWLGANFQFSSSLATPEPGSLLLAAAGFVALLSRRARRRGV